MSIRTYGFNDSEAILALCNHLRGTPLYKYEIYITYCDSQTIVPSWKEFQEILKQTYKGKDTELNLRQRLRRLRLKNFQSLALYNDEFMKTCHAIGNIKEVELIDAFVSGMDGQIHSKIIMESPEKLEHAMRIAQAIEIASNSKQTNINYASRSFNAPKSGFKNQQRYNNNNYSKNFSASNTQSQAQQNKNQSNKPQANQNKPNQNFQSKPDLRNETFNVFIVERMAT